MQFGLTALHHAALSGEVDSIRVLVQELHVDPDIIDLVSEVCADNSVCTLTGRNLFCVVVVGVGGGGEFVLVVIVPRQQFCTSSSVFLCLAHIVVVAE